MKKTFFIAAILLVAVISTACINNFAVQDLNNKAKVYMEKGDYTQAIERLKSSIDLAPSVFETHYNLAVAYTQNEDYQNAIEEYKKAIEIKPDSADSYYSLATAENNLAVDMTLGKIRINQNGELYNANAEDVDFSEKYNLSNDEKNLVEELNNSAILNYQKYLELNPNAEDKEKIEEQIQKLQNQSNSTQEQ